MYKLNILSKGFKTSAKIFETKAISTNSRRNFGAMNMIN